MSVAPMRKETVVDLRKQILLQIDDPALAGGLGDALVNAGYMVHTVRHFKDLPAWLMLHRDATLVIALPAIDFFRRSVLREVRRLAPTTRIVALAQSVTDEVQRDADEAKVERVIAAGAPRTEIVDIIKQTCS